MTAPVPGRRRVAAGLGVAGALLLGVAGLIQITLGAVIPDWTGDKLAPVGLGLLTVALAAVALVAGHRFRRPDLPAGQRAAWALGLAGPGLLCLTTVGVLAWVPAILLVPAGALAVADGWRESARAVVAHWMHILLSALGCCELLMAAASSPLLMAAGAVAGAALILAAWLPAMRSMTMVAPALLAATPFTVMGWYAVVPLLVAVVAVPVLGASLRRGRATGGPAVRSDRGPEQL